MYIRGATEKFMKTRLKFIIPISIVVALFFVGWLYYPRLTIISGFAAKNMCSCVFEAGRSPESVAGEDNNFGPIAYAKHSIDREGKRATASVYGMKPRTAAYTEGIGCVLLPADMENRSFSLPVPFREREGIDKPYPYGHQKEIDTQFAEVNYEHLNEAVGRAFKTENKTRAVLVLYKGNLLEERYLEGFSKDSKFLGWSMTKSITSAVLGILEKQGRISLDQDQLFSEWSNDQRAEITLNDLIQMNSGLEWEEDYSEISDVTRMLFLTKDMSRVQLEQPLLASPGDRWNYSSGTTNLIVRFIRNQFPTHQQYLDFWYSELIDRIGMYSMTLETDFSGKYVGSSYAWATARDWARFGQLYLDDGYWNGHQLFSNSWMDYTLTPVKGSEGQYGAHFWLNAGGIYPNVPRDLISANGFQGQYIFVIPSKDLVVVRFGLKEHPEFNVDLFLQDVLKAFHT